MFAFANSRVVAQGNGIDTPFIFEFRIDFVEIEMDVNDDENPEEISSPRLVKMFRKKFEIEKTKELTSFRKSEPRFQNTHWYMEYYDDISVAIVVNILGGYRFLIKDEHRAEYVAVLPRYLHHHKSWSTIQALSPTHDCFYDERCNETRTKVWSIYNVV